MANSFFCRVCGLKQEAPPWGLDERSPTFEICDCCGIEFGYEDSSPSSIKKYRESWLASGAQWFNPKKRPTNWNLDEQLKNLFPVKRA